MLARDASRIAELRVDEVIIPLARHALAASWSCTRYQIHLLVMRASLKQAVERGLCEQPLAAQQLRGAFVNSPLPSNTI